MSDTLENQQKFIYSAAVMTVPTQSRVGMFPMLVMIFIGGVIFYLTFQYWLTDLTWAVNQDYYLEQEVINTLCALGFPACILFAFMFSQVRHRLNLKPFNAWSVVHTIIFLITIISLTCYGCYKPQGVFGFMQSLLDESTNLQPIIDFVDKFGKSIQSGFNDPTTSNYKCFMIFASYSFIVHFMYVLIFATAASDRYGERLLELGMRRNAVQQNPKRPYIEVLVLNSKRATKKSKPQKNPKQTTKK